MNVEGEQRVGGHLQSRHSLHVRVKYSKWSALSHACSQEVTYWMFLFAQRQKTQTCGSVLITALWTEIFATWKSETANHIMLPIYIIYLLFMAMLNGLFIQRLARPLKALYTTCQHSLIHTHTHTFIHWWQRLPCKVPTCSSGVIQKGRLKGQFTLISKKAFVSHYLTVQ